MELRCGMHDYLALAQAIVDEFDMPGQPARITLSHVGELHAQCDAGLLSQVISNLLANALTHGEPGAPVQMVLDGRAADHVEIRVVNRGELDPSLLPALFEPFHQSGEKRRTGQGLGLGLSSGSSILKPKSSFSNDFVSCIMAAGSVKFSCPFFLRLVMPS